MLKYVYVDKEKFQSEIRSAVSSGDIVMKIEHRLEGKKYHA